MTSRNQTSGFFNAGSHGQHRIYWNAAGAGKTDPWLVVHGNAGYTVDPSALPVFDETKQDVLILHQRGVGLSAPPGELSENLYADLADDIETLRAHLDIPRLNLLAWSGGTSVAALYARKHPERTGRLVVYAPFFGTRGELEDMFATYPLRGRRWQDYANFHGTTDTKAMIDRHIDSVLSDDPKRSLDSVQVYCWLADKAFPDMESFIQSKTPAAWETLRQNFRVHTNQMRHGYGLAPDEVRAAFNSAARAAKPIHFILPGKDKLYRLDELMPRQPGIEISTAPDASHDIHDPAARPVLQAILRP